MLRKIQAGVTRREQPMGMVSAEATDRRGSYHKRRMICQDMQMDKRMITRDASLEIPSSVLKSNLFSCTSVRARVFSLEGSRLFSLYSHLFIEAKDTEVSNR
jgi:hypothetical protein